MNGKLTYHYYVKTFRIIWLTIKLIVAREKVKKVSAGFISLAVVDRVGYWNCLLSLMKQSLDRDLQHEK